MMATNKDDSDRIVQSPTLKSYRRSGSLANLTSTFKPSPVTTSHGFASLIQKDDSDGSFSIHEYRDLANLTDTLTDSILECYTLDAHNRAQELQFELLDTHTNRNVSTIERLFRNEIQVNRRLIDETLRKKVEIEKQFQDIHQITSANQEHYQQLLAKRNAIHKDLFTYQQQIAQNHAESEFLRSRIQSYNDEIQYYKLKNPLLLERKKKFHCEIEEEFFAQQILKMECEVLENEKQTNEDIHLISIEDLRSSISLKQIETLKPSSYFREQLIHQIRQMRIEYNKKLQIYRDELHRQFEYESSQTKISQTHRNSHSFQDDEDKLDNYRREKYQIEQEIHSVRSNFHQLENQMTNLAQKIDQTQYDTDIIEKSEQKLMNLEEIIREKQEQLNDAIRIRMKLKEDIDYYRNEVEKTKQQTVLMPKKSILRRSQTQTIQTNQQIHSSSTIESSIDEGTLTRCTDFDVQRDCQQLNKIFEQSNINTSSVINILCNRNVAQRLQIRDTFRHRFNQNLGNLFDSKLIGNAKKLLKLLLLSPIEFDCYEFRRILRTTYFDENIFIELLLSRSNRHKRNVLQTYFKLFKTTLKQDILNSREKFSKEIFVVLLDINRPEETIVNQEEILNDARYLYTNHSTWKVDGSTFIQLISKRSNEQLKQIFDAYQQFSSIDIEQAIKIDTDPSLSRTLMAIVRIVRNRSRFFAYELRKSLRDSKTNEDNLNRIIITRCEIDMVQIKIEYENISKFTLHDQIQTDTTSDYKRALLELLRQRIEPSEISKKTIRRRLTWKDRTTSDSNINQFDRNNQAKSSTLSTIHSKPAKCQISKQKSSSDEYSDD